MIDKLIAELHRLKEMNDAVDSKLRELTKAVEVMNMQQPVTIAAFVEAYNDPSRHQAKGLAAELGEIVEKSLKNLSSYRAG